MKAHGHALTGFAVGAAALPLVMPDAGLPEQVAWVATCGGMALLSDLDKRGTTAASMWGPVSQTAAAGVGWVARGHRMGTHDAVLAPLVSGGLAAVAAAHPGGVLVVLAVAIGLMLRACAFAIPGRAENTPLGNAAASWGGAWVLVTNGAASPAWLPLAVALGVLAHIAGDALTPEKVPVPVLWIVNRRARVGLPLFTTGTWPEKVAAAAIGALAVYLAALNILDVDLAAAARTVAGRG